MNLSEHIAGLEFQYRLCCLKHGIPIKILLYPAKILVFFINDS